MLRNKISKENEPTTVASIVDITSTRLEDIKVIRPETDPEAFIPLAPDGGYGYVVLFASFMMITIVDGLVYSFGLLLSAIIDYFDVTTGQAALTGSLFSGLLQLIAPFSASLINAFDCRKVCMFGSLMGGVSVMGSSFAKTYNQILIFYGVFGGLFIGIAYLPPLIIVNSYFEKKRGMATGILFSGSAIGCLMIVPLNEYILENYGLKLTLCLQACLLIQCFVLGCLMRPLKPLITLKPCKMVMFDEDKTKTSFPDAHVGLIYSGMKDLIGKENLISSSLSMHRSKLGNEDINAYVMSKDKEIASKLFILSNCDLTTSKLQVARMVNPESSNMEKEDGQLVNAEETVLFELPDEGVELKDYSRPMYRKDILLPFNPLNMGSIIDLPDEPDDLKVHSQFMIAQSFLTIPTKNDSFENKLDQFKKAEKLHPSSRPFFNILFETLNLTLLCNFTFVMILFINILFAFGGYLPCTFYATYSERREWDNSLVNILMVVFAIASIFGRLFFANITEHVNVDAVHIFIFASVAWIFTYVGFAFCNSIFLCFVLQGFHAILLSPYVVMTSILCVQFLGIESLTNAMGFLSLGRGIFSLMSGPVAGLVIEASNEYTILYLTVGTIPVILILVCSVALLVHKKKNSP